jgi:hypothetical protein
MTRRTRWFAFGGMSVFGAAAALVVACGGDDSGGIPFDGSTPDNTNPVPDTSPGDDTGNPDVSPGDGNTQDVASDGSDASCPGSDAALDEASVASGLAFVTAKNCMRCHQAQPADAGIILSGRTTSLVDGGMIYPPNLTPDPATGLGCWTDQQIATAILTGVDNTGKKLCVMPKFGVGDAAIDGATAEDIVQFLRSLPAVVNAIPDTVCPTAGGDGGGEGGGDASDASDGG